MILYRDLENNALFQCFVWIMENGNQADADRKEIEERFYEGLHGLLELSESHGLEGNLWHSFLTFLLVNDENAYSKACEIRGAADGSINRIAGYDFEKIKKYFDFDFRKTAEAISFDGLEAFICYKGTGLSGRVFNRRMRERIHALTLQLENAEDAAAFKEAVTDFYGNFGVGRFGLHKAFRVEHREGAAAQIVPITNIAHVHLDDLIGYEIAKQKLIENTEAFVNGREANNCLLFGDAGTGKSTSIKAIANQYYDRGLRLIEIYKHQFCDLHDVIAQVKSRNYKFIIYMDDLSFEEFEVEYKYLKAVIEGGLEKKPDNILIYATSNRRHLIRENFSDKEEIREDMHTSDTVQEKLSLYARFGVSIYFGAPDKKEFQEMIKGLAKKHGIDMPEEDLLLEANRWELSHGGRSGRTAQQFINYLLGKR